MQFRKAKDSYGSGLHKASTGQFDVMWQLWGIKIINSSVQSGLPETFKGGVGGPSVFVLLSLVNQETALGP